MKQELLRLHNSYNFSLPVLKAVKDWEVFLPAHAAYDEIIHSWPSLKPGLDHTGPDRTGPDRKYTGSS